jgi:hypothetical protein
VIDADFQIVDSGQYRTPASIWADIDALLTP